MPQGLRQRQAKGCQGLAWVMDGQKDLQTKLPDFTTSSLCLWTGMGLGALPASHHLEAAPCPWGFWVAPGPLDLRFYLLGWPFPCPYHCAVCCILTLLPGGLPPHFLPLLSPSQEGQSTPEPGGRAWPCTDFYMSSGKGGARSGKGESPGHLVPSSPFPRAVALNFPLCLPSPRCQIAITSS